MFLVIVAPYNIQYNILELTWCHKGCETLQPSWGDTQWNVAINQLCYIIKLLENGIIYIFYSDTPTVYLHNGCGNSFD